MSSARKLPDNDGTEMIAVPVEEFRRMLEVLDNAAKSLRQIAETEKRKLVQEEANWRRAARQVEHAVPSNGAIADRVARRHKKLGL